MTSIFTQTRDEPYTLTVRIKNVFMKITEECWMSITFRLNGSDQESDSIPLSQSDVNGSEIAQILTNCSFSQSLTVKVQGSEKSSNTGRSDKRFGNKSPKGREKFTAKPFELILSIYNQKHPMGKKLYQDSYDFSHLIKKGVIKGLKVPQEAN